MPIDNQKTFPPSARTIFGHEIKNGNPAQQMSASQKKALSIWIPKGKPLPEQHRETQ